VNTIIENMTGTNNLTDQIIAADLLISAKSGIKDYAIALSETVTPEVRNVLRRQLDEAIVSHEQVTNYMMSKGWYHAYDVKEQIRLDIQNAKTALNLAQQQ
jgi:similar to spore coat protein